MRQRGGVLLTEQFCAASLGRCKMNLPIAGPTPSAVACRLLWLPPTFRGLRRSTPNIADRRRLS